MQEQIISYLQDKDMKVSDFLWLLWDKWLLQQYVKPKWIDYEYWLFPLSSDEITPDILKLAWETLTMDKSNFTNITAEY